jgi:hypothetical protein
MEPGSASPTARLMARHVGSSRVRAVGGRLRKARELACGTALHRGRE